MSNDEAATRERRTLRNIALNFTDIGADLGDLARKLLTIEDQVRLRVDLLALGDRLGHLGDTAHLARHALRDMARGDPGAPVNLEQLAELVGVSEASALPLYLSERHTAKLLPRWKRLLKRLLKL